MKAKYSGIRAWTRRYSKTAAEFHKSNFIKISKIDSYASQRAHAGARWRAPMRVQAHTHAHAHACRRVKEVKNIKLGVWLLTPEAIKYVAPIVINPNKF